MVNGTLHIPALSSALLVPFRAQDQCLMDHFSLLPGATRTTLAAANGVRLFYGVAYLSEITTTDRRHLPRDAWEGTRLRISPLLWPFQPKPGPKSFRAWRRLLNDAFLRGPHLRVSSRTWDLRLRTTLGSWLPASSAFRFHWDAFYAPSTATLYVVSADGISFDIHASRRIHRRPKHPVLAFSSRRCGQCPMLPEDAAPADYATEPNKLVIPPVISQIRPPPAPVLPPLSWNNYVRSLPPWEQFLFRHVTVLNRTLLFDRLRNAAHICLASDGGAANCKGSYGCVFASDDTILLTCGGHAEGADPKSFHFESYGMLAILRLTFHFRWFYVTRNHSLLFTVYCDSESLVKRLNKSLSLTYSVPRRTLFSEADVEIQIIDALSAFAHRPVLVYVAGHQDEKYPGEPLSWPAQVSQACDDVATKHLESAADILYTASVFPASRVVLTVNATTITHHIPSQLRAFAGLPAHRTYLCHHHDWTIPVYDLVSWKLLHACSLAIPFLKRLFLIKMGQRLVAIPAPTTQVPTELVRFLPVLLRMSRRRLSTLS
jgi:hypothetical protein